MATFTPSWTTGTVLRSSAALNNGASLSDAINLATLGYYEVEVQIDFDIATGTPNGDLLVEVFGSSDGGTTVDTIALTTRRLNFTATGNKKLSIPGIRGAHRTVKYTNSTGANGTISVRYCGMKQASA